jgi:hypothetical protein
MLVKTLVGLRAGEVIDLLPLSALAMLADGRAVAPDDVPVTTVAVEVRSDRGMPKGKARAHR